MIVSGRYLDNTMKYNYIQYTIHTQREWWVTGDWLHPRNVTERRGAKHRDTLHHRQQGWTLPSQHWFMQCFNLQFVTCSWSLSRCAPINASSIQFQHQQMHWGSFFKSVDFPPLLFKLQYFTICILKWVIALQFTTVLWLYTLWLNGSIHSQFSVGLECTDCGGCISGRWPCLHSYWFLMRILETDVVLLHCCLTPCQHLLILMVVFILQIMPLHLKEVEYPLKKMCFSCNILHTWKCVYF